jgi:hypothetical protein
MFDSRGLASGFLNSLATHGNSPALEVASERRTYAELFAQTASLPVTLVEALPDGGPPLTAVFTHRSVAKLPLTNDVPFSGFVQGLKPWRK